jgi:hypothetical protein
MSEKGKNFYNLILENKKAALKGKQNPKARAWRLSFFMLQFFVTLCV